MAVHIAGPLGTAADSSDAFGGLDSTLLLAALTVVIVLLLVTYRSPVLWLLPVISAGAALVTSQAVIYLLARNAGLTVNAQSAGILSVLVFGAGTDYALLLTARYREELRRHADRHQAMAIALRRAGPAIIASAGTVILAMLALMVAELNSTSGLGPVLAIGVGVALLAMLTLLPALLVTCGRNLRALAATSQAGMVPDPPPPPAGLAPPRRPRSGTLTTENARVIPRRTRGLTATTRSGAVCTGLASGLRRLSAHRPLPAWHYRLSICPGLASALAGTRAALGR